MRAVVAAVSRWQNKARVAQGGALRGVGRLSGSKYETLYEEEVERLKSEYPSFCDEETGEFTGPVTTNAIEGGNWRMKEKLGVPYRRCRSARGRVLLGGLSDSLSIYRNGRPHVSFAQKHGTFRFEKIMADDQPTSSVPVPPAPPVPGEAT